MKNWKEIVVPIARFLQKILNYFLDPSDARSISQASSLHQTTTLSNESPSLINNKKTYELENVIIETFTEFSDGSKKREKYKRSTRKVNEECERCKK